MIRKIQTILIPNSYAQAITTRFCNNGLGISVFSVHSRNYGMPLISKIELPQIRDPANSNFFYRNWPSSCSRSYSYLSYQIKMRSEHKIDAFNPLSANDEYMSRENFLISGNDELTYKNNFQC